VIKTKIFSRRTISEHGNSLTVTIPPELKDTFKKGMKLYVSYDKGVLCYSVEDLNLRKTEKTETTEKPKSPTLSKTAEEILKEFSEESEFEKPEKPTATRQQEPNVKSRTSAEVIGDFIGEHLGNAVVAGVDIAQKGLNTLFGKKPKEEEEYGEDIL